jgi:hypothetical protein
MTRKPPKRRHKLTVRSSEALDKTKSDLLKLHLGPQPVYIISGASNVQKFLTTSPEVLDGDFIHMILMTQLWGLSPRELGLFRADKSGRHKKPFPGFESKPFEERFWYQHNKLYIEYLTEPRHSDALVGMYLTRFTAAIAQELASATPSADGWGPAPTIMELLRTHQAESAIATLFGTRVFELSGREQLLEAYWGYDAAAGRLIGGPPSWMQPKAAAARDKCLALLKKHVAVAWEEFPPEEPSEVAWEPVWGARLTRESAAWLKRVGISDHGIAGHTLATLFGYVNPNEDQIHIRSRTRLTVFSSNGNSTPITSWAMMYIIRDPELAAAVRKEIAATRATPTSPLDPRRIVSLPLLQSIYIECMRLHVSFAITRTVRSAYVVPGYTPIPAGSLAMACSCVAHLDEKEWGAPGHPAAEFWAWRHVKTDKDGRQSFVMAARPSSFFPFGGGFWVCPGRHFGKMEILLSIALLVSEYDFDFVEWLSLDGQGGEREPQSDKTYAGQIAMFPDRDLRFRWRKIVQ